MKQNAVQKIALRSFLLVVLMGLMWQAKAQDAKTPYPSMAPLEQYLMERNAEIALARSAAPESISRDAEIMVLGQHGYETAIKGKNDFACLVWRSWIVWNRRSRFLESQTAGPGLPQHAGCAVASSTHTQENRGDLGFAIQRADVRGR